VQFFRRSLALVVSALAAAAFAAGCGGGGDDGTSSSSGVVGKTEGESAQRSESTPTDSSTGSAARQPKNHAPLTKAEFQKKAKALCIARSKKYVKEVFVTLVLAEQKSDKPKAQVEREVSSSLYVPYMEEKLDEVRELGIPKGDEAQVNRILAAIEGVVRKARKNFAKFQSEQATFKHPFHHANELAKGYGLSACAR
jgi:hypothetical protein